MTWVWNRIVKKMKQTLFWAWDTFLMPLDIGTFRSLDLELHPSVYEFLSFCIMLRVVSLDSQVLSLSNMDRTAFNNHRTSSFQIAFMGLYNPMNKFFIWMYVCMYVCTYVWVHTYSIYLSAIFLFIYLRIIIIIVIIIIIFNTVFSLKNPNKIS